MAVIQSEIVSKVVFENNPLKVCYSGQVLKGVVKICFPSDTCFRAIYVKIVGEGFYSWVDDVSDREKTGSIQHFVKRIDLVPVSNAGFDVSAGSIEYPFEIQLPSSLPTSYEGTYGHVRYTLALLLAPPGTILDPIPTVETFTVVRPLNLNNSYSFIFPERVSQVAKFNIAFTRLCVLFRWKRGYLKVVGSLPVSGYCSGQIMNLQLDVINESGQGVLMVMVTAVTGLWLYKDLTFELPVIIGTYPITNEMYHLVANQSARPFLPSAPTEDVTPSAPSESIAFQLENNITSVPPTYEEVMRSDTDGHTFTPKYPVYSSSTSYSNENCD